MRISDWSSDVCSSDLDALAYLGGASRVEGRYADLLLIGGASAFENQKLRRRSLQAAVTGSGGPVLVLPDNAKLERVERAVLGWDASSEARRAARDLIDVADPGAVIDEIGRASCRERGGQYV